MTKAKKINVYLNQRLETELQDLVDRYGVSYAYVLLLAYKLSDRQQLIEILQLQDLPEDE